MEYEQKKFTRRIENFTCEKCGVFVEGNGYTNHCPKCLCSKHVDVNPGDRKHSCGGLMRPASVIHSGGEWIIAHECLTCGFVRRQKSAPEDDFETIVNVSRGENL